jgi:hypothetical protein
MEMIMKFFAKKVPPTIYFKLRNLKMSSGTFSILMSKEDKRSMKLQSKEDNNICPLLFTTMAKGTKNNYQSE